MQKKIIVLGLVTLTLFPACRVTGDKYQAPEVDAADLYGDKTSADTTTIAGIPWRKYFTDSGLIGLIEEGIENNYDLQIAHVRIQSAAAALNISKAAYYPDVSLTAEAEQSRTSMGSNGKNVLGYHSTVYSLGIIAGWELDLWGKLNSQSKSDYAALLNSYEYKNLTQTALIAGIATYYYTLLSLDEQLKIMTETAKSLEENVTTMEALKNAGLQNGAAVAQSKATLYSTLAAIPDLENEIKQTENAISVLLGRNPGTIGRSTLNEQTYPAQMQYGVPAQMLAKRPDVRQAELSFRSCFELTNVARANFYPAISLTSGFIGYSTTNTLVNFFKPENIFASIIGGLTQPLFDKKRLINNLKIARAEQQEALLTFRQTVLNAGKEVSDILYSFESSVKKNDIRNKQVEACRNSVEYTKALLIAGDVDYTDVLMAQQSLLAAQLSQVTDKLSQLESAVNLYRALGGGTE